MLWIFADNIRLSQKCNSTSSIYAETENSPVLRLHKKAHHEGGSILVMHHNIVASCFFGQFLIIFPCTAQRPCPPENPLRHPTLQPIGPTSSACDLKNSRRNRPSPVNGHRQALHPYGQQKQERRADFCKSFRKMYPAFLPQ